MATKPVTFPNIWDSAGIYATGPFIGRVVAWDPGAKFDGGGYGRKNGNPQRERLWLSPACLPVEGEAGRQVSLFGGAA